MGQRRTEARPTGRAVIFLALLALLPTVPAETPLGHKLVGLGRGLVQMALSTEGHSARHLIDSEPDPSLLEGWKTEARTVVFVRHGQSTWNEIFNQGKGIHRFLWMPLRLARGLAREALALALLGLCMGAPVRTRGKVLDAESGAQARSDIDGYFAQQSDDNIIKKMEAYKSDHGDELEFNHLPCHGGAGASFKLACESVSFHMRNRGRVVQNNKFPIHEGHQKRDQKLFTESFIPEQSRHLDVVADSSFSASPDKTFDLHYADGSHLRGFTGNSVVNMGDYEAEAPFGVITDCNRCESAPRPHCLYQSRDLPACMSSQLVS
jgi:hypothetical protein